MTETTTMRAFDVSTSADSTSKPTGAGTPADALGVTKRMTTEESDGQESTECPTCGDSFSTETRMRKHHAHKHGESLVEAAACEWCGEEIDDHPSGRTFCSFDCRSAHRAENGLPARSRQVTLTCEGCGEEFDVPRSDAEAGKKYCSNECYHNDSDAEWLDCEWCGDEFRAHGEYVDEARFCSQDCYGEWISENQSGEDSVHWKGGYSLPDEGWVELRSECLEKFSHRCQGCGLSQEDSRRAHGVGLSVHHIQPRTSFDDPTDADTVDNLVPLCRDCHNDWEGVPVRPELND